MLAAVMEAVTKGFSLFFLSVMIVKTSHLLKHLWHLMPYYFPALEAGREKCIFSFTTNQNFSVADSLGLVVLNCYKWVHCKHPSQCVVQAWCFLDNEIIYWYTGTREALRPFCTDKIVIWAMISLHRRLDLTVPLWSIYTVETFRC